MKRIPSVFVAAAIALIALASCKKENSVKFVSGTLTIDESEIGEAPVPDSYKVIFSNIGTGVSYEFATERASLTLTDASGIVPGIYDIVASATASLGGMNYNYIGTLSDVEYSSGEVELGSITVSVSQASALIFKEVHYNASKTLEGKSYLKDTFLEIYNNSEETVWLDGICLGNALSYEKFDFSGSASMLGTGNADDYIFIASWVWQIPGGGQGLSSGSR